MNNRKRLLQLLAVCALATANSIASASESTLEGTVWCADSCSYTSLCEPQGGRCDPKTCLGIDDVERDYTITCNNS